MPIYMDRHDIPKEIKAAHVAEMHQADLKIEHLFGCKGMTYWCDEERNTAFCLIEAPNKKAIQDMHNYAHGELPHSIIEVDEKLVASFLGRIGDPEKEEETKLNIISDSAFRVIMIIETSSYLNRLEGNQFSIFFQKFHNSVLKTLKKFHGSVVKSNNNSYLISFKSITNAVLCGLEIQFKFKYVTPKFDENIRKINIALGCGNPVTDKVNIFEDAIIFTTRMCEIINDQLVISSEVNSLFENENRNAGVDKSLVRVLKSSEEKFLTNLMDIIESNWCKPDLNVTKFCRELGMSKSQLYRKLINLTGKSPNNFLRDFRLQNALSLLHNQEGNISEIAFQAGFNSAAYFSKCFLDKYGILPSKYVQQHII